MPPGGGAGGGSLVRWRPVGWRMRRCEAPAPPVGRQQRPHRHGVAVEPGSQVSTPVPGAFDGLGLALALPALGDVGGRPGSDSARQVRRAQSSSTSCRRSTSPNQSRLPLRRRQPRPLHSRRGPASHHHRRRGRSRLHLGWCGRAREPSWSACPRREYSLLIIRLLLEYHQQVPRRSFAAAVWSRLGLPCD